jgi:hypothetical protein
MQDLMAMRVENQLLEDAQIKQQEEMSALKRTCQMQDAKIQSMQGDILEHQQLKLTIEEQKKSLEMYKNEVKDIMIELDKSKRGVAKWKKRAIDLSRDLGDKRDEVDIHISRAMESEAEGSAGGRTDTANRLSTGEDYEALWNSRYSSSNGSAKFQSHLFTKGPAVASSHVDFTSATPAVDGGKDGDNNPGRSLPFVRNKSSSVLPSHGRKSSMSVASKKRAVTSMQRYFVP